MYRIPIGLLLLLIFSAACGSLTGPGSAGCPSATNETRLLENAAHGYCVLYPKAYATETPNPDETVLYVGSLLDVEHPRAYIEVEKNTKLDAAQAADRVQQELPADFKIERKTLTVGGEPAVQLDNVPGQDLARHIFVVHKGTLYKLTFVPADAKAGEIFRAMDEMYNTMISSFTFK